jgi:hypothetical protein
VAAFPSESLAAFIGMRSLLQAAIDIHDRQVRRCERWTYLVPIWVALIAGVVSVFVVLFRWQTGGCP